jgi:hypothetical protein
MSGLVPLTQTNQAVNGDSLSLSSLLSTNFAISNNLTVGKLGDLRSSTVLFDKQELFEVWLLTYIRQNVFIVGDAWFQNLTLYGDLDISGNLVVTNLLQCLGTLAGSTPLAIECWNTLDVRSNGSLPEFEINKSKNINLGVDASQTNYYGSVQFRNEPLTHQMALDGSLTGGNNSGIAQFSSTGPSATQVLKATTTGASAYAVRSEGSVGLTDVSSVSIQGQSEFIQADVPDFTDPTLTVTAATTAATPGIKITPLISNAGDGNAALGIDGDFYQWNGRTINPNVSGESNLYAVPQETGIIPVDPYTPTSLSDTIGCITAAGPWSLELPVPEFQGQQLKVVNGSGQNMELNNGGSLSVDPLDGVSASPPVNTPVATGDTAIYEAFNFAAIGLRWVFLAGWNP